MYCQKRENAEGQYILVPFFRQQQKIETSKTSEETLRDLSASKVCVGVKTQTAVKTEFVLMERSLLNIGFHKVNCAS